MEDEAIMTLAGWPIDMHFGDSLAATAIATVAPTIGLLPIPMKPIIATWAGTEELPANWASSVHSAHGICRCRKTDAGPAATLSGCNVRPVPPPEAAEVR